MLMILKTQKAQCYFGEYICKNRISAGKKFDTNCTNVCENHLKTEKRQDEVGFVGGSLNLLRNCL